MSGNSHENNIRTLLVKFTKVKPSGLETDARWKDLVQLYKVCNTEEDSRDMNLLNSPECEDVRKGNKIDKFDIEISVNAVGPSVTFGSMKLSLFVVSICNLILLIV